MSAAVVSLFKSSVVVVMVCAGFLELPDLLVEGSRFEHRQLVGYTQLALDEARNQVLVGAQDFLFRLSLDDLDTREITDWRSPPGVVENCINSGQNGETCHNFVRVLLLHGDQVFTCGTNSFSPSCTWREADSLKTVTRTIEGKAICPYGPLHNTTALMTDHGELYSATIIDKLARDPAINRNLGSAPSLRTEQMNSKWLNEPNFVSTYEFGNFVYFFFREIAVEYINCGKKVYSRAARVCKTDRGGTILLEGKWTTFHKARLNCSRPGHFPFYFDELQSTYYSADERLVYALFTTPQNSMAGSAVCAYDLEAFDKAFSGPFKFQKDSMSAWIRHDNGRSEARKCVAESGGSKRSSQKTADHLVMAQKYQLMDQAVQPVSIHPILVREQQRWTHVVVDHVITKHDLMDVLFLATEDGKLHKMLRLPPQDHTPSSASSSYSSFPSSSSSSSSSSPVTCLVEDIKIVPNGQPRPVKAMKFSATKGAIYIATDGVIIKVPVHRCSRFKDSSTCLASRDPYCGWDTRQSKCTPAPDGNPHADFWEQDISGCPNLHYTEDGAWSPWSDWSKCQQVGGDPMVDQCQCRSRSCDSPKPTNGGRRCEGSAIEVANCTIHGQWTDWSEWSACSQTCGYALRERRRQCGNPPPQYGGRLCGGTDSDKEYCAHLPACPLPPVDGQWAVWSGWSGCTKDCNGGIQTRRRSCNRPQPRRGGKLCYGNKEEWRMCNTHKCEEISRISPWTEWIQTNRTGGGYFEQRFRFTCRANVARRNMIKTSFAKGQARFCHNNGHGCQTAGQMRSSITSIDTFSSVDRVLRRFCRYKRRLFRKYCNCRTLGVFLVCQKCGYG
ncbi:semaphorin-5A-like [Babylonia areolata]|uniref:semaphorin-5A-like n=1 Tax=Babylonia areolata TaxID=304850 RepID=UPI003FD1BAFF